MDNSMLNLALFIKTELQADSPIKTGNMRSSIEIVQVGDNYVDIVVATDYASYVNERQTGNPRTNHYHWIQATLDRACRCLCEDVESDKLNGLQFDVNYGV